MTLLERPPAAHAVGHQFGRLVARASVEAETESKTDEWTDRQTDSELRGLVALVRPPPSYWSRSLPYPQVALSLGFLPAAKPRKSAGYNCASGKIESLRVFRSQTDMDT